MFYVIHLTHCDGEIEIIECDTVREIREYVKDKRLGYEDYAVVKGQLEKSFHSRLQLKNEKVR